jgi:hypothetical protein
VVTLISRIINEGGYMNKASSDQKPERSKAGKSKSSQSQIKSKSTGNKGDKVKDEDGILVEAARKIETGAKVIGEKAVDVADKLTEQTSEFAEIGYDKLKKSVSDVYDISFKTFSDMSKKAVKYVKKYENTVEMKKLNNDRNTKMQELGTHIFTLYKSKSQDIKELLANEESQKILNDLEILNKAIVKIGRKIKRKI